MPRFGFSKKEGKDGKDGKDGDGNDANRSALFGRKKNSPAPQSDNPYAKQGVNDPYAANSKPANLTPYQKARSDLSSGVGFQAPPPYEAQPRNEYGGPSTQGRDTYGAPPSQGYGKDKFGSGGGYGANRYESSAGQSQYGDAASGSRGPGGYGGFSAVNDEPDNNRNALFSGAQQRYDHKKQTDTTPVAPSDNSAGAGTSSYGGGYGDERELTQEEQEEAEVQAIMKQTGEIRGQSVASLGRSLQMTREANARGQETLARLGAQGERLHNTEKHLDLAANQNKIAQDRAAELKTLNRSMFAVKVSNPFTASSRQIKADEQVLARHRTERAEREATRKDAFAATQRMEQNFSAINKTGSAKHRQQSREDRYNKFRLEEEEGAEEMEDQIDDGLNELEGQVSMMNMVGRAIGKEVDAQNTQIERIMNKSDLVDDATRMNRERLARIK